MTTTKPTMSEFTYFILTEILGKAPKTMYKELMGAELQTHVSDIANYMRKKGMISVTETDIQTYLSEVIPTVFAELKNHDAPVAVAGDSYDLTPILQVLTEYGEQYLSIVVADVVIRTNTNRWAIHPHPVGYYIDSKKYQIMELFNIDEATYSELLKPFVVQNRKEFYSIH